MNRLFIIPLGALGILTGIAAGPPSYDGELQPSSYSGNSPATALTSSPATGTSAGVPNNPRPRSQATRDNGVVTTDTVPPPNPGVTVWEPMLDRTQGGSWSPPGFAATSPTFPSWQSQFPSPQDAHHGQYLSGKTPICKHCGNVNCSGCRLWDKLCICWQNAQNGPQSAQSEAGSAAGMGAGGGAGGAPGEPGTAYGASGLGGSAGGVGNTAPPAVIGDMLPLRVSPHSEVPTPGSSPPAAITVNAALCAFKVAENQSPRPIDRVFGSFNYYDSVNRSYDARVNAQVGNVEAYRQLYGFEKTFLGGQASLGMRQTINSINVDTQSPNTPGGMFTASGTTSVFGKYVVLASRDYSNLLSVGIDVTLPTGPKTFGGYPNAIGFRDTQIQPFVGYILSRNRWYLQGFSSVSAATDPNDVTFFFNDVALGYYAYRAQDASRFLSAVVPTFETHVNTPLNHQGFHFSDPASQPYVVDLTFGTTFVLRQRSFLTFAYVTPVTGPKPFEGELAVLFNYRFGGLFKKGQNQSGSATTAPAGAPPASALRRFAPRRARAGTERVSISQGDRDPFRIASTPDTRRNGGSRFGHALGRGEQGRWCEFPVLVVRGDVFLEQLSLLAPVGCDSFRLG